jgi:hypothetical protein
MTVTTQDLVRREVHYCVSSLVSTLAGNGLNGDIDGPLGCLADQAFELAAPVPDYEEAAREAGWVAEKEYNGEDDGVRSANGENWAEDWKGACEQDGIEPYDREVFEHWIVSDWLADRLAEKGEKVDKGFAGMAIWARTSTDQAIYADAVIEQIAAELNEG